MRDRRVERFSFPFSLGCVSHSSIDIVDGQPKKPLQPNATPTISELVQSDAKTRTSSFAMKPSISAGLIHKVVKGFKNLSSYMFQFYKEEEEERDMVIGFPTDVQHVAHIGWDGLNSAAGTAAAMKGWDNYKAPDLLSLPSISLRQFELAMAAQQTD